MRNFLNYTNVWVVIGLNAELGRGMTMLTTNEIDEFYAQGLEMGKAFMLVALDTFSYDYYPVFTDSKEDAKAEYERLHEKNMQKVLEVYDLNGDRFGQLNQKRCNALMAA